MFIVNIFLDTIPASVVAGSVTTTSSNLHSNLAKAGDVITIQFTISESVNTTNTFANLNNQNLTISVSGTSYTATYTVKSIDTQGPITTLFYLVDIAGNFATDSTQPVTAVRIGNK